MEQENTKMQNREQLDFALKKLTWWRKIENLFFYRL